VADGVPKRWDQGGGVIKDAVDVRSTSVDRGTVQVDIGRFAVDGLAVARDSEEGMGHHRRARGEGDGGIDNGDWPRLGAVESRSWEGRGQRRRGGCGGRGGARRIIGDTLWEDLDGHYGSGSLLIIIPGGGVWWGRGGRTAGPGVLEIETTVGEVLEH
jgi:hypothetical protein